jgi:hypothetical protein
MSLVGFMDKRQQVKEQELTKLCEKRLADRTGLQCLAEEAVWELEK